MKRGLLMCLTAALVVAWTGIIEAFSPSNCDQTVPNRVRDCGSRLLER